MQRIKIEKNWQCEKKQLHSDKAKFRTSKNYTDEYPRNLSLEQNDL